MRPETKRQSVKRFERRQWIAKGVILFGVIVAAAPFVGLWLGLLEVPQPPEGPLEGVAVRQELNAKYGPMVESGLFFVVVGVAYYFVNWIRLGMDRARSA